MNKIKKEEEKQGTSYGNKLEELKKIQGVQPKKQQDIERDILMTLKKE